jgi:hypothetical protein
MAKVLSSKHEHTIFEGSDDECAKHLREKIHASGKSHTYVLNDDGSTSRERLAPERKSESRGFSFGKD